MKMIDEVDHPAALHPFSKFTNKPVVANHDPVTVLHHWTWAWVEVFTLLQFWQAPEYMEAGCYFDKSFLDTCE